jgi:hypothetical protein
MTSFTPTRVTLKGDNDLGGTHRSEAGLGWSGLALSGTVSAGGNGNNFQNTIERRGEPGGSSTRTGKSGGFPVRAGHAGRRTIIMGKDGARGIRWNHSGDTGVSGFAGSGSSGTNLRTVPLMQ